MSYLRKPALGYGLYLAAALMWSVNGSVSKLLLETGITSMRLSQFRASAAWFILFLVVLVTNRAALKINGWKEFRLIALYGILGVTMTQWLYFVGIQLLPVGVALIIEFTAPLMVALWVRFAWSFAIPRLTWLGLFVALAGLVFITEAWNGFTLNVLGVLASAGAAAALALYYLAGEKVLHQERPRDPLSLTMWGFAFAAMFWAVVQPWWDFPWEYFQGTISPWGEKSVALPRVGLVTWMVVLGTVVPFWLGLVALRHISSQQASATGMTEPVMASLVAWLVMGELLSGWQIIGGAITLSGIFLAEWARSR